MVRHSTARQKFCSYKTEESLQVEFQSNSNFYGSARRGTTYKTGLSHPVLNVLFRYHRTLHGKTGELTTQINNLHNVIGKIQAGGSVGASTGGGITRQEFNSMLNAQNELKSIIYNIKYVFYLFCVSTGGFTGGQVGATAPPP